MENVRTVFKNMIFADHGAGSAENAFSVVIKDFWVFPVRFRIVAPGAPQGAPFQKYGRPDPGPVVRTEALDVEYSSCHIHTSCAVRSMISVCISGEMRTK